MIRYTGNSTPERFPRASRDDPARAPGVLSGPHRRAGRDFLRRAAEAIYWAAAVAALLSMFAAPNFWRAVAGS